MKVYREISERSCNEVFLIAVSVLLGRQERILQTYPKCARQMKTDLACIHACNLYSQRCGVQDLNLTPAPSSPGERQKDCPKQLLDTLAYGEEIGECHIGPEEWTAAFMRFAEAIYDDFR